MKNFKISIAWLAVLALVFTSCSKEESGVVTDDQELIQVTFGSLMNDFNSQNKQADPGECSDADPAYVHVAITDSNGDYIGEDDGIDNPNVNFIPIDLKWNSAMSVWETVYTDALALEAGDYTLQHFIVFDADDNVIWVAPRTEGAYGSNVDNPLPNEFTLEPGTKPYITVDVLCFIPRNEEAFGYLFFDINLVEIENNYCLFVNFCADDGRDYPAHFSVDVWTDGYGEGIHVIDGWSNDITMSGGLPAASVLCLPLPELMGDDTYFVTVTVMNDPDLDYNVDGTDVKQFEISQADIDAQLEMTPRYEHVRFECGEDNGGGDEGCDLDAACVLDASLDANCYYTMLEGATISEDGKMFLEIDEASDLEDLNLLVDLGPDGIFEIASVNINMNGEVTVTLDTDLVDNSSEDRITAFAIELRPSENGSISQSCWESECANVIGDDQFGAISEIFDGFDYSETFYISVDAVFCQPVVNP